MEKKHWRERLLDGITLLVALAALFVIGERYLWPAQGGAGERPEGVQVEKELTGHTPGAVSLVAPGGGEPRAVSFAAPSPQLVVLFRSDCPACQATKPTWERIAAELPEGERVHAITAEPTEKGAAFFGSERVEVWSASRPEEYRRAYPSPYVPTTLVVGPDGKVRYARVGVLQEDDVEAVKTALRAER